MVAVSLKTASTSVDAYKWTSPVILGLFGTSAGLFVVFLVVELKWAAEPVMPFELLHRRTPIAVAINNFVLSVSLFGCVSVMITSLPLSLLPEIYRHGREVADDQMYTVPLYFTAVRQMSASYAGAHLIPNAIIGMAGSLGCGFIVRQTGKYYWLNFFGGVFGIISAVLLSTWDVETAG